GQAIRKLHGWVQVKGALRCPACEAKRRVAVAAKQEKAVETNVAPIRQPTMEQKRQIMLLLTDAYDTAAGRYRGGDTDKTLADAIGGGCMPGWVAEVREQFFGPDGGNDAIEDVIADLKAWQADMDQRAAEI